jgi:hypothetical protein
MTWPFVVFRPEHMNTAQFLEWVLTGGALVIAMFVASNILEKSAEFQSFDGLAKAGIVGAVNLVLVLGAVVGVSALSGQPVTIDSFVVPSIPVIAYWAQQVNHQGQKASGDAQ